MSTQQIDPWAVTRTPRDDVLDIVAFAAWCYGVTSDDVFSASRERPVVAARHSAIQTLKLVFPKFSNGKLAQLFGRDRTTIISALNRRKARLAKISIQHPGARDD